MSNKWLAGILAMMWFVMAHWFSDTEIEKQASLVIAFIFTGVGMIIERIDKLDKNKEMES